MIKRIVRKITHLTKLHLLRDPFLIALGNWYKSDGEHTLKMNYDLDEKSLVFDVGGFRGDFASDINQKYHCEVWIFEPMEKYFSEIKKRFENNPKIRIFNFGLSDVDGEFDFFDSNDGSGFFKGSKAVKVGSAKKRNVTNFILENRIEKIDLLKMNIEGGEYEVLPSLIKANLIGKCRHIQVQFHNFFPNSDKMRNDIRTALKISHIEGWCFPFVWESWSMKT